MTREEAIEVYYGLINTKIKEAFEFFAPELAESEGERIRKELKEAFEAYDIESKWNGIPIRSIFAWLEKQKPAEWSEEDRKMLDDCIMALSNWRDAVANYGHEVAPCQELIDWLKSLRPSWKPSIEQMKALMLAIEGKCPSPTSYLSRRLEDLYEGLANTYGVECDLKED